MSPAYINNASSWEEADAHFEQFMASLPERRTQLTRRLAETGGPGLDGTLDGLDALNEWYIDTALADQPDGMDWWPTWLAGPNVDRSWRGPEGENAGSPEVTRLWELIGVYLGDLTLAWFPQSRWVCWRDPSKSMYNNGHPIIDVGLPRRPMTALSWANVGVPRAFMHHGTGSAYDERPDSTRLRKVMVQVFDDATARLAIEPVRWQRAPTGPDAHRRTKTRPF